MTETIETAAPRAGHGKGPRFDTATSPLFAAPPAWSDAASCATANPELFFDAEGERGTAKAARQLDAKAVCATCAVRAECLTWAIDTGERHGVWGGLTETERRNLTRNERRRENRKDV